MSHKLGLQRETMVAAPRPAAYADDYAAWAAAQAEAMRAGRADDLDLENLADAIGDLDESERREIESRMAVLLLHLLKWRYQPERPSDSWLATISEQRLQIAATIADSPSLRAFPEEALAFAYDGSIRDAARESGLPRTAFPTLCPYSIDDILRDGFYPEGE